jgi:predicted site-specific integrase-resolvase
MKLSEWAKKQGITYKTAWRWWKAGQLPVPAVQMASGTVVIQDTAVSITGTAALYARVSSSDQKKDLEAQLGRLAVYASANGYNVSKTAAEVGSGLNGHRPRLMKLLSDPTVTVIIVEHRDRLMRFGAEYVESALAAQGRKVIVVDPGEVKDDLVQDMMEVLTSFCARLYGRRSARNKAKKALEAIHE